MILFCSYSTELKTTIKYKSLSVLLPAVVVMQPLVVVVSLFPMRLNNNQNKLMAFVVTTGFATCIGPAQIHNNYL